MIPFSGVIDISNGTGGDLVLNANPCLAAGYLGQTVVLINAGANSVTINRGTGILLGAPSRVIGTGGSLTAVWTGGLWQETGFVPSAS
jgi:hypothetical protein